MDSVNSKRLGPRAAEQAVLTVEQLAERWSVNPKTIYAAIESGELHAIRLGRVYRIPMRSVELHEQPSAVPARSR